MTAAAALDIDATKLMKQLDKLPSIVSGKISRKAVNAGSLPILKAARASVPVGETGNLKESLGRKTQLYKRSETAVAMVGPRIKGGHLGYHGHLVEYGHINADGSFTPGHPWLSTAQHTAGPAAINRMRQKLASELDKAVSATT